MSILVVDRSERDRTQIGELLETAGFGEIILVDSSREAIRCLEEKSQRQTGGVELILLDILMPEITGIEMCRQIKATVNLQDIPIIITAEGGDLDSLKLAFAVGATDYIGKPVDKVELMARVRSLLTLKHEMDERKAREREILKSLRYAHIIQSSLLPGEEMIRTFLPESFFIWMPRDIVSGDIYHMDVFDEGILIALIDCTGHGVPGAFMSIVASTGLKRITQTENIRDPSLILKRLNLHVKTSLHQDKKDAVSDDGLDAAICFIDKDMKTLSFAGAMLSLYYVFRQETVVIKGDRHSIGYKRSRLDYEYTLHEVEIEPEMRFFLSSDGYYDQLGGHRGRPMGGRKFRRLLQETSRSPFERQHKLLVQTFREYKGAGRQVDDVTVAGFGFDTDWGAESGSRWVDRVKGGRDEQLYFLQNR